MLLLTLFLVIVIATAKDAEIDFESIIPLAVITGLTGGFAKSNNPSYLPSLSYSPTSWSMDFYLVFILFT